MRNHMRKIIQIREENIGCKIKKEIETSLNYRNETKQSADKDQHAHRIGGGGGAEAGTAVTVALSLVVAVAVAAAVAVDNLLR